MTHDIETPRRRHQRPRYRLAAVAAAAAAIVAGSTLATAGNRPPLITIALSAIAPGPDPLTVTSPSLARPTPPPPGVDRPLSTLSVSVETDSTLNQPLLTAINAFRRVHHLHTLTRSPQLNQAAGAHAHALAYAGLFEHEWPDGRRFDLWIRRYYPIGAVHSWSVGENLLWNSGNNGSLSAQQALAAWIASPTHLHILLGPGWRQLGIGAVAAQDAQGAYGGNNVFILAADFGART